ncbi:hypothetical protein G6O69_23250 [Pseudenhygromyxa sp. WMMC2535]|uniref:hypothetical protein n=1 Tax=Pseudenhygromyxa sp. WMMC2535 TaxID=2712867 RepID=UPI0015533949|nr:hypothetical protein [Pseudenhygromyxa sp. WMMC2535]NVB40776.1 hypothetical protein [Pseudenhygromyxa sp. WMMC2535]
MPTEHELEAQLREAHTSGVKPPVRSEAGEAAALASWAARYAEGAPREPAPREPVGETRRSRPRLLAMIAAHRFAAGLGLLLSLVAAACVLPTSYEIPLGIAVEIAFDSDMPDAPVDEMAERLRVASSASEVSVFMRRIADEESGGEAHVEVGVRLWDQQLGVDEVEGVLRESFPETLAGAEIEVIPLEGEVSTIWARRLAHRAFHVSLREADLEQARAQVLADLERQGFGAAEVSVEVLDHPDGRREVSVEIERRLELDSASGSAPSGVDEGEDLEGRDAAALEVSVTAD